MIRPSSFLGCLRGPASSTLSWSYRQRHRRCRMSDTLLSLLSSRRDVTTSLVRRLRGRFILPYTLSSSRGLSRRGDLSSLSLWFPTRTTAAAAFWNVAPPLLPPRPYSSSRMDPSLLLSPRSHLSSRQSRLRTRQRGFRWRPYSSSSYDQGTSCLQDLNHGCTNRISFLSDRRGEKNK